MQRLLVFLLALSLSISLTSCREKVDGGNEAVLVNQYGEGKGQGVSVVAGATWYNPFTEDVFQFPLFVQNADYPAFSVTSKGGPIFQVDPRLAYTIQKGRAADIFRKYRKEVKELEGAALNTYTRDAFRLVFNRYTPDQIVNNRDTIESQVTTYLSNVLEADGFHLEQLTYSMRLPDALQNSIDAQAQEITKTKQAESRLKTAEMEAREKIISAEADAKVAELQQRTLTPLLIQKQFIDKWSGTVPLYGNAPTLFKTVK